VTSGFWAAYAALCLLQGAVALVSSPSRPGRAGRARLAGLVAPAALLVGGVLLVRDVSDGARALADLATFGTPVAASLAGWLLAVSRPWIVPPVAAGLYVVAWRVGGLTGDAAGVLLIAGACLSGAALAARLVERRALAAGLVLLVVLDVILVFGTTQVTTTATTLHAVAPPTLHALGTRPLPALQDVTLGSATMGWLDLLAPALLGAILAAAPWSRRAGAAAAVAIAALAWGALLEATDEIPATVPVLAGLAVVAAVSRRRCSLPGDRAPAAAPRATHLRGPRPAESGPERIRS
jgi:hypothetical protein